MEAAQRWWSIESNVRILVQGEHGHLAAMARHIQGIQHAGKQVVYVAADRPASVVHHSFAGATMDLGRLHILDMVSMAVDPTSPSAAIPNTHFVPSPNMLEMVAMRLEQVLRRLGPDAHVVVDSLNTLCLHNGAPALLEFTHYLTGRLRALGVGADLVVRDNAEGMALQDRLSGVFDPHNGFGTSQI